MDRLVEEARQKALEDSANQKWCSACRSFKAISEFGESKEKRCKECKEALKPLRTPRKIRDSKRPQAATLRSQEPVRLAKEPQRDDYPSEKSYSEAVRKRRWKLDHREQHVADSHNHRAKKLGAVGKINGKNIRDQLAGQGNACFYCSCSLEDGYHVEHVVPLSRGGSNLPDNIVCACPACNLAKWNRTPDEWQKEDCPMGQSGVRADQNAAAGGFTRLR